MNIDPFNHDVLPEAVDYNKQFLRYEPDNERRGQRKISCSALLIR